MDEMLAELEERHGFEREELYRFMEHNDEQERRDYAREHAEDEPIPLPSSDATCKCGHPQSDHLDSCFARDNGELCYCQRAYWQADGGRQASQGR